MKTIDISAASKTLAEYTSELEDDFVLLTSNNRPVAAIVSLKNIDPESLALSTNAEFLAVIDSARRECAAGETVSLGAMKEEQRALRSEAGKRAGWDDLEMDIYNDLDPRK